MQYKDVLPTSAEIQTVKELIGKLNDYELAQMITEILKSAMLFGMNPSGIIKKYSEHGDRKQGAILSKSYTRSVYHEYHADSPDDVKKQTKEPRPSKEKCYVYFIEDCASGHIKIGKAIDVMSRFKSLKTGSPAMSLIGAIWTNGEKMAYGLESSLHARFKDKRVSGEWFSISVVDVMDIKSSYIDYWVNSESIR